MKTIKEQSKDNIKGKKQKRALIALVKPYTKWIILMLIIVFLSNFLNLIIPTLIANTIDSYGSHTFNWRGSVLLIFGISTALFFIANIQVVLSVYIAERFAFDLRNTLAGKLAIQSYTYINKVSGAKLLTNFTSDIDAVKNILTQAVVNIVSALILVFGSIFLMMRIDVGLTLIVLTIIPFIILAFALVFGQIKKLFTKVQKNVDMANTSISETISGASLIRVLNTQKKEEKKYEKVNEEAKGLGLQIVKRYGVIMPVISLLTNIAILMILWFGGIKTINGDMTIGEITAFGSYVNLMVFPIIMIGMLSSMIARAMSSFERVNKVLTADVEIQTDGQEIDLKGSIEFKNVTLHLGGKDILKDISFKINPNTKNAILGPTAAGKTMIFYIMTGLLDPTSGEVFYDGIKIKELKKEYLYSQIGLVFQENIIFNDTIRKNIVFSSDVEEGDISQAIQTSELDEFISTLENGVETILEEGGSNLSGGQKQRLSLARALSTSPKVLLLDDFTARVDIKTERNIFRNIDNNYKNLTQIVISQKISSIEDFDQILLLMNGELIKSGTHKELMSESLEYQQIYKSQQSINSH